MEYFRQLLEREYTRLKDGEKKLVRDLLEEQLRKTKMQIGVDALDLIGKIEKAEEDLAVAKHEFDAHSEIDEQNISQIAGHIFSAYEQKRRVVVGLIPDYKGLAKVLTEREKEVSCIVHHGSSIFDPKAVDVWEQHEVKPGDKLVLYLHNLNGKQHSLDDLVPYLGKSDTKAEALEVDQPYVTQELTIELEHSLHARPGALIVKKASQYDPDIFIRKVGTSEQVSAKSILGIMTLGASKGSKIMFLYEKPRNKEDEKKLQDIMPYMASLLNGSLYGKGA
jgi:phosphotransferase system HPr (HPr) family protein